MKKRWMKFETVILSAGIAVNLSSCGDIFMSAGDRVGGTEALLDASAVIEQAELLSYEDTAYFPYDLAAVAEAFGLLSQEEIEAGREQDSYGNEWLFVQEEGKYCSCRLNSFRDGFWYSQIEDGEVYASILRIGSASTGLVMHSIFTRDELQGFSSEEAVKVCNEVVDRLGVSAQLVGVVALDAETLNDCQKEMTQKYGGVMLPAPGSEKNRDGVFLTADSWEQEQEAYAVYYQLLYQGRTLGKWEDSLILFCRTDGVIVYAQCSRPVPVEDAEANAVVNAISGEDAYQLAVQSLKTRDIEGTIQTVDASYYYGTSKTGTITLLPCWRITYQTEKKQRKIEDYFLLDGITGMEITNDITY